MKRSNRQPRLGLIILKSIMATIAVILFCFAAFSAAYFLSDWLHDYYGLSWNEYYIQLATWALGIVIFVIAFILFNVLTRPHQMVVWNEMLSAFRKIAKGDFNVVIDEEGKYRGQIGEFVDSINEMTQELKQVEQLRQQFISNVSHEIQSPLTSIRGFANMLQREDLTREEQKHYLSIIENETVRLSRLSDNLMKLTSLESDQVEWEISPFRLDKQLTEIVLASEPHWLEKNLEIELELDEVTVSGNAELLSQVWLNLLHNAIKFTPPHGHIRLALRPSNGNALVRVCDTGIGIPPEDQKRIFERFFKGDKQRTRTTEGNGLGLSIVQRIVELHQGEVRVRSMPQEGTTFEVELPLVPAQTNAPTQSSKSKTC
ncbi:HAMP domain-containing sensor histidine kinase [Paenibacillus sp. LHD-117]|uniref:sensor histidine kinase n=1 Tax=Paenibacillus sp. LHD-117 TaxID=3071412 RepID=UPI0027E1D684|nr:HAMP domain-containing sensor histidine kinase [Paenibacillus sp. LHD-117]MDQ6421195.1 HAMP domain-containing sensor histidine kinase [Paenibacillus sp. LHD-117]